MLKITKNATTVELLNDATTMVCTRFVNNKLRMLIMLCDGSVGDYANKFNRAIELTDDMFEMLDRIRREAMSEEDSNVE